MNAVQFAKAYEETVVGLARALENWAEFDADLREQYRESLVQLFWRREDFVSAQRTGDAIGIIERADRKLLDLRNTIRNHLHLDVADFVGPVKRTPFADSLRFGR